MDVKVIAVDIDGVLTSFGEFFQISIPAWRKTGIKVGILTGRPQSEQSYIMDVFKKVHLDLDFYLFKPQEFVDIPNGVWKAVMCQVTKIDILFDDMEHDDPAFITDLAQVIGNTQVFTPVNYRDEKDAYGDTIQNYVSQMVQALEEAKSKEKK